MSDCCSALNNTSRKHRCPVNNKPYSTVSMTTVLHHLSKPWEWLTKSESYYFCDDPACDVVYFGNDDSLIYKSQLRTSVGLKEESSDSLVCYCFGLTVNDTKSNSTAKHFVITQTKNKTCACEVRNPSGKCCLKDFPQ